MGLAANKHPLEGGERPGRLAGIDGIGEVPRGQRPGHPEERLEFLEGHRGPRTVGGGQRVEQALEATDILPEVLGQVGRRRSLEPDGTGPQLIGQPLGARLAGADRGVHRAAGPDAPGQRRGNRAAAGHQHEDRGLEGILQVVRQPFGVRGSQLAGLAQDHHPPFDQERRGGAGVDHRPHIESVEVRPAELLDHQRGIPAAHQSVGQGMDRLGHQGRVVPLDQVGRKVPARSCRRRFVDNGPRRAHRPALLIG
jgi:hypothetical protein